MASSHNVIVRTLITYLCGSVMSVFFLVLVLPMILLPESMRYKNKLFFWLTSRWSKLWLYLAGISLAIRGDDMPQDEPVIFVMNHGSALDILLIEALLGAAPRIWLSKDEYRKMPLLNWILMRMHVMVDATSAMEGARALKMLQKKATLGKSHVLLFPEGGRYSDGEIHRFFKGFSLLADVLSRPVVPVYIDAAHKAYSKDSVLIQSAVPLLLDVGPSFVRAPNESHEHFVERVRDWFIGKTDN